MTPKLTSSLHPQVYSCIINFNLFHAPSLTSLHTTFSDTFPLHTLLKFTIFLFSMYPDTTHKAPSLLIFLHYFIRPLSFPSRTVFSKHIFIYRFFFHAPYIILSPLSTSLQTHSHFLSLLRHLSLYRLTSLFFSPPSTT